MAVTEPLDGHAALQILQSLPLGITVVDGDGVIRWVNAASAAVIGSTPDAMLGKPALASTVAESDTTAAIEIASRAAAGERWIGRFPLTGPDGRRVDAWFAVAAALDGLVYVGGPAAEIEAALGDGDDSESAQAERRRREAEEANRLLTTLLDAVPVGLAFFDRDGRMVRVNEALAAMVGVDRADHIGKRLDEVLHAVPDDVATDVAAVFEGRGAGDRFVTTSTLADPTMDRHWIMSFYPVRLRGEIPWVGVAATEVTAWRRAEEERDRLLQAEQAARESAEASATRLAQLQIVTANLAEAIDRDRVADVILTHGANGVGATGAALMTLTDDGQELAVVAAMGFKPEAVAAFSKVALTDDIPVAQAVRDRSMLIVTREERDERWPALAAVPTVSAVSAVVPLLLDDALIGVITFGWAEPRTFDQTDHDFLSALGRQCVLALERVRLYDAERSARAAAEEARSRMAFLAEASRVLGERLDYAVTFPTVAKLIVENIADACTIQVIQDRDLALIAATHRDPAREEKLRHAASRRAPQPRLLGAVAASGEPRLVNPVTPAVIRGIAVDEEHEQEIAALDLTSLIVVPLLGAAGVLGTLSVGTVGDSPRFSEPDLGFVQDLGTRVGVALENSLAHAARTEVVRTLQSSLLPPVQPTIPGLDIAQRYHSVGDLEVGGDFFDVFPSGDGRWGVVMGDVCGRGAGAASLTALARYTVRAAAIDQREPSQVLRLLNRAILDTVVDERFCTIAHAVVEPMDDRVQLTLACGGHPLPLLLRADGSVSEVGVAGTAIGLFEQLDLAEVEVELRSGDAIVFFTDGLTEARAPDGRFAPDLLEAVLRGAAGGTAEELAEAIDRAVVAFEGGRPRDDMALLILRVAPA